MSLRIILIYHLGAFYRVTPMPEVNASRGIVFWEVK